MFKKILTFFKNLFGNNKIDVKESDIEIGSTETEIHDEENNVSEVKTEPEKEEEIISEETEIIEDIDTFGTEPRYDNVVVFLDAGHTCSTPGKSSPDNRLKEWKYNRLIVSLICTELDRIGIKYWVTHPEDDWVDDAHRTDSKDLLLRVQRINGKYNEVRGNVKKAFMISVHVNASGNGEWKCARGWSAYTTKGQNNSDKLAECLYDSAEDILSRFNQKIRKDLSDGDRDYEMDLYVLKHSNLPCVLTENFFMDNKNDVEFLLSEEGKDAITKIHVEGILKFIQRL